MKRKKLCAYVKLCIYVFLNLCLSISLTHSYIEKNRHNRKNLLYLQTTKKSINTGETPYHSFV